jgi:hypothetical protein
MLLGCRIFFLMVCCKDGGEVYMLKDAGDRVYTMACWTLRGFVYTLGGWLAGEKNVSFVLVIGASASPLGNSRVCTEVVCYVSPACITSSRYICFWMT